MFTMSDEIMQKLSEHDKRFDVHDKHFERIEEKLDEHTKILSVHSNTLDQHTDQLETIARTVAENKSRLDDIDHKMDNFVTKQDHQEVMNTLDKLVGLVEKKDQEMVFMGRQVKENSADIERIKPLVGLEV